MTSSALRLKGVQVEAKKICGFFRPVALVSLALTAYAGDTYKIAPLSADSNHINSWKDRIQATMHSGSSSIIAWLIRFAEKRQM